MKEYTTKFLKSVALCFMAFPVLYIVAAALIFDVPAKPCVRILLSPSYYLLCFWATLTGYGLWEMKRWTWYVFLFTNILIVYSNALVVSEYGESNHKLLAFLASTAALIILIFRVGKEVKVPYFLPRIRWWESDPRYRLSAPVAITRENGGHLDGEILDLSMGGCFIKLRTELSQNETITVKFVLFGQVVETPGSVVWRTMSTVTNPKGVGVKFAPLPKVQKKVLKAVTLQLKKISQLYRSSRYLMTQDEFFQKMREMQNEKIVVFQHQDKPHA